MISFSKQPLDILRAIHEKRRLCKLDNAGPDQPAQADLGLRCPLIESMDGEVHVDGQIMSTAHRINGWRITCRRTDNVQIRLHGCARSSGPSLFAYGIRAVYPRCTSDIILPISTAELSIIYSRQPLHQNM